MTEDFSQRNAAFGFSHDRFAHLRLSGNAAICIPRNDTGIRNADPASECG
ncbi:hypothetical protein NZL82_13895 [Sphingomonas sanguinis]|jgi:hypothetical protein|nr:hypothetical protein [Sphingomonas sp. LC-1]MCT8002968.1 hypothetical protein [Sphingomonas sp. LC-1]